MRILHVLSGALLCGLVAYVGVSIYGEAIGGDPDDGSATCQRAVQVVRIGSIDRPRYALRTVTAIVEGPKGDIYVLQWGEASVRVYSASGRFLRTIGGKDRKFKGPRAYQAGASIAP